MGDPAYEFSGPAKPLRIGPAPTAHGDPLIDALIDKLPPKGTRWPIDERLVWLRMATMAFDLAYGIEAPIAIAIEGVPRVMDGRVLAAEHVARGMGETAAPPANPEGLKLGPRLGKKREADQVIVICLDGMIWKRDKQITPKELGPGDQIWDFRPGDQPLDAVVWGDGETYPGIKLPPLEIFKG